MNLRLKTTASLLAALASGQVFGCSASSEDPSDPNPSGSSGDGPPNLAPPATADVEFLETYAETNRFRLGRPRAVEVLPDGSGILFLRSPGRSRVGTLYYFDVESGAERPLLTVEQLLGGGAGEESAEELARRERMRVSARGIVSFRVSPDGARIIVPLSGRLFLVDRARIGEDDAVRELESDAGSALDPQFSPDGTKLAVVREGDLYIIDLATGSERRLTTRGSAEIQNGLAEFVAQEEMSRMRGYWFSPDSRRIAYQETDTTGVERMHILDPMHPEQEARAWPYPRPGRDNASVRLGVIGVNGGATRWLEWDRERYPYLCSVRWPSDGTLSLLVQDREQQREVLLRADPATGQTTSLLEETDDAWLNLDQSVPRWLGDGSGFLWSSERDGEWHLELRSPDGALVRALTPDGFGYRSLLHVDEERGTAWVSASPEPSETHVYRVPLSSEGEPERATDDEGEHQGTFGDDGSVWVHAGQTRDGILSEVVRRENGDVVGPLGSEAEEPAFEPNLSYETIGEPEWRAVIVRPQSFDEDLVYPVILHVYGGPHARYVTASPSRYLLDQWQADHNFIVVSIDGRGTPGRGSTLR